MAKHPIPVFDICSLNRAVAFSDEFIAEPLGAYLQAREKLLVAHSHSFYHLALFTAGSGTQTIDFEQFDIKPGDIYFMIPGQVHSWHFTSLADGYVVNFSDNLLRSFITNPEYLEQFSFLRGVARDSIIALEDKTRQHVIELLEQLVAEVNKKDEYSMDMIRCTLLTMFIAISRRYTAPENKQLPDPRMIILSAFRKLVNERYAELKLPKDYAALLFITPNRLNALCNELLGKPAGQVIRERILLEAKRLLINAKLSVAEVAYKLNFEDNSYFTRFFKKYVGLTPKEFRRM